MANPLEIIKERHLFKSGVAIRSTQYSNNMKINIHAPFEVNPVLKQLIQDKIEKLTTYFDRIYKADVYFKLGDGHKPKDKMIEINLHVPVKDIFAKDTEETFEKAVAKVTKKLETQLKRRKEILAKKY